MARRRASANYFGLVIFGPTGPGSGAQRLHRRRAYRRPGLRVREWFAGRCHPSRSPRTIAPPQACLPCLIIASAVISPAFRTRARRAWREVRAGAMTSCGLELVELERGLSDQCRIAVRLRKTAVVADRLVRADGELVVALLKRNCGSGEQRGRPNGLAAARATARRAAEGPGPYCLRPRPYKSQRAFPLALPFRCIWCCCHQMNPPLAARNRITPAMSQLPFFLRKSCSRSRRRFSSTSRTNVSVMSGGCAKVLQSTRSGIQLPIASLPHP